MSKWITQHIYFFHSCVKKEQCQDAKIDIRGSGDGPVCNDSSLVCCHPQNVEPSTSEESECSADGFR